MGTPADQAAGAAAIAAWCGWHVAPTRTDTVKIEGDGGRVLLLPSLNVRSVTQILDEDGNEVTDYKWRQNGVLRGCWACEEEYTITFVHGYDSMPTELQAIVDTYSIDGTGSGALRSRAAGPFSESYGASDLEQQPMSVRAILGRYQLPARP